MGGCFMKSTFLKRILIQRSTYVQNYTQYLMYVFAWKNTKRVKIRLPDKKIQTNLTYFEPFVVTIL
jgi:hypothetical protein